MNSLTPTQDMFLRSMLSGIIQKAEGNLDFSIVASDTERMEIQISGQKDGTSVFCEFPQEKKSLHVLTGELQDFIIRHLADGRHLLWVDEGDKITQIALRENRVLRETLEKRPDVLKNPLWSVGKVTHLDPNQAAPLLKTIGLMTPDGEIRAAMRRKFKQVNHFLDLMIPILKGAGKGGTYQLVDCGCGKTYLGFVLFWYLRRVLNVKAAFLGIDVSEHLIEKNQKQAQQLGLSEMKFQCSRILEAELPKRVDLLVSLHACDTATDEAITCGVISHARNIVVVPCCQQEIAGQLEGVPFYPLRRHGLFTQRFGDLLTDMLRALFLEAQGYNVTAGEFVATEDTPKNLMLRATLGNNQQPQRMAEYQEFKNFYKIAPSLDLFLQEREVREQVR
ncbi:MAG: class I SAM-dependent methyltransferase [bacterium]|jgi:hypothetical protein